MKAKSNKINYIEFKSKDLEQTKTFYKTCFGWKFKDYGDDYTSFKKSGIKGGFHKTDESIANGTLVVLYHKNLDKAKSKIVEAGGEISVDIFSFPGGSRFQFIDPSGNELAVWSDK